MASPVTLRCPACGETRQDDMDTPEFETAAGWTCRRCGPPQAVYVTESMEMVGRRIAERLWHANGDGSDEGRYVRSRTIVIDEVATGRGPVAGLLRASLLDRYPNGTRHDVIRASEIVRAAVIRWNDLVRS